MIEEKAVRHWCDLFNARMKERAENAFDGEMPAVVMRSDPGAIKLALGFGRDGFSCWRIREAQLMPMVPSWALGWIGERSCSPIESLEWACLRAERENNVKDCRHMWEAEYIEPSEETNWRDMIIWSRWFI
jgi:hypothetical protein